MIKKKCQLFIIDDQTLIKNGCLPGRSTSEINKGRKDPGDINPGKTLKNGFSNLCEEIKASFIELSDELNYRREKEKDFTSLHSMRSF